MHLTAHFRHSRSSAALIEQAREVGIELDAMQQFPAADRRSDGLVFGYGAIGSDSIEEAVRRLARLMK